MLAIANFLTGFKAIVLGFLIFIAYRLFEVQALFFKFLPLSDGSRFIASCLISVVVVFSLMVFSAHINQFKLSEEDDGSWIKWLMFLFTLFINFFFWEVWNPVITVDNNQIEIHPGLAYAFKGITTFFFGTFDFAYNHLLITKWNLRDQDLIDQRQLLQNDINELSSKGKELQLQVSQTSVELSHLIARQDPKVCPRCGQEFESYTHRNGHLRTCKSDAFA